MRSTFSRESQNSVDTAYGGTYGIAVIRAVIDTNVLVAALRSSTGASHEILLAADRGEFEVALFRYSQNTKMSAIGLTAVFPYPRGRLMT